MYSFLRMESRVGRGRIGVIFRVILTVPAGSGPLFVPVGGEMVEE